MKKTLLFAIITLLYACKTKEEVIPNRPPNAFTVTPTLKSDGKTIVLNWNKSKDPDGDAVTYAVVLKDTLVKNISDTTYTIASLDFNYSQAGKVIAKDAKGLISEASFTATTKTITFVNIPDAIFEKYLVDSKIDKDGLVNGKMELADAKGVTKLTISGRQAKSLVGIEAFTDLQDLNCTYNELVNLDLSKNIALQTLRCRSNQLKSLDLSKNIALQNLYCLDNQITTLNLINNSKLLILDSKLNQISTLDLSKNTTLQVLDISSNLLKGLSLGNNTSLRYLYCDGNMLTSLDLGKNLNLQYLICAFNQLINLDVTKNIVLEAFNCSYNQLTTLDISKNAALLDFSCSSNLIKTICVADKVKADTNKNWYKDKTAIYEVCK